MKKSRFSEEQIAYALKQAETALRESERFARGVIDALSAHIVVLDSGGRILASNLAWREFAKQNGVPAEQVSEGADYLGVCDRAAMQEGDGGQRATAAAALIRDLLSGSRKNGSFEYPCHSQKEERWFFCRGTGFRNDNSPLVVLAHTDITDRKKAELKTQRGEKRFRDLFDFAPDAIVMTNAEGLITDTNEQAGALFGYAPEELHGQPVEKLVPDANRIQHPKLRQGFLAAASRRTMGDTRRSLQALRKDGTVFSAEISLAPIESDAGLLVATAIRDISEREKLEVELRRIQRLEATGNLIGGLAHDLNNYLATIIGNLDLLQDRVANDAEAAEYVDTALSGALRCAELTKSLLAFARRQPLSPREMDIRDCVNEVALLIEHTLGEDILVETEVAPDLWPVRIDDVMLNTSIINLANNARDSMPRGGKLTIAARNVELDQTHASKNPEARAGDFVLIEVSDTGGGMTPEILAKAFEPFYTTKGPGHGTGLGLSMVHGFVKQSGGHIGIYSEAGHGTAVRIYLPRVTDAQVAASPSSTEPPMSPRGAETILLVDDNQAVRGTAARLVADLGYRVLETDGAEAAVDILTRGEPMIDLLFTDIVMPGDLDGYALARIVGERWPHIKVLLTSGFTGGRPDDKRMQVESLRVLMKPYRKNDLARALRATLDLAPPPRPPAR